MDRKQRSEIKSETHEKDVSAPPSARPVPATQEELSVGGDSGWHLLEREIQRELRQQPGMKFSRLVVRRIRDGVCLEGLLLVDDDHVPDIAQMVRELVNCQSVVNRLQVLPRSAQPERQATHDRQIPPERPAEKNRPTAARRDSRDDLAAWVDVQM